jgi:hypothetical protein
MQAKNLSKKRLATLPLLGIALGLMLIYMTSMNSTSFAADCAKTSVGFTPLTDLGTGTYKGFEGGLYPGGSDQPPAAYLQEGLSRAAAIQPLSADGQPDAGGNIVLLSIGMSNTTQEFSEFKRRADADSQKNPRLVIVDGAQGGQDAEKIKDPNATFWTVVDQRLSQAGVSNRQVQAVWLKEAIAGVNETFPLDAQRLQTDLDAIVQILMQRYPSLQIVYLSSRIYAGYATTGLNPEPFSYQSGFAVKWLIEDRINGRARGPWLAWGPYLWTDGMKGRSDGLIWTCNDVAQDGTHPSPGGRQKVAELLLSFFKTDQTAVSWFSLSAPSGDFTLSASPASQTIVQGASTSFTVNVQQVGSFTQPVNLSVNSPDNSISTSFSLNSITPGSNATLTVNTRANTPASLFTLNITGRSGQLVRTAIATVNVVPAGSFTIAISPASQTVTAGASTSFTIDVLSVEGFSQPVSLSAVVSPPNGNIAANFSSNIVTPGTNTTMTVGTVSNMEPGTFTIPITGSAGQLVKSSTATLSVLALPDFSLDFNTPTVTLTRGQSSSTTVNINRIGGFSGNVAVTAPDTKLLKIKITPPLQSTTGTSLSFSLKAKKKAPVGAQQLTFIGRDDAGRTRTGVLNLIVQ